MAELRTILYGIILLFNHISEYTTPLSAANPYLGRKPLPDILPSCSIDEFAVSGQWYHPGFERGSRFKYYLACN